MGKKSVITGAVLIAILLLASILFVVTRPSPMPITVRHIKSVHSGGLVTATFEITNHATNNYIVFLWWVEASNGSVWKMCFDLRPQPALFLDPNGSQISTFRMTNLPTGSPLRLRMGASKELAGLEGIFLRLDLRFRRGQKQVSVNPFDKRAKVFSMGQIVSEEFVEHEPK